MLDQIKPVPVPTQQQTQVIASSSMPYHPGQAMQLMEKYKNFHPKFENQTGQYKTGYPDTIIVGIAPYDSLVITGSFTHTGPIIVGLKGVLIIKDAKVTNLGDLIVFGHGKVFIDSSTVSFPQDYFYQRAIILVNDAYGRISNTTLSYGGFVHSCSVADSARLDIVNVTQPDFMTTGMSNEATININGTNQAGEFILEDSITFNAKNATTVLLWHQFPDTAVINWSFGMHDSAYNYHFNKSQKGVQGVEYKINVDSCYNVMWAMMPSSGSKINISNSKIRSIGLWFDREHDSIKVSSITDNSSYTTYTTPLSDRTLTFNNCSVETWSFYVFHKSVIDVSGCIAGEIGTEGKSKIYGNNYWVDGSGGYHWSSDTSEILALGANVSSYVRSEKTSVFFLAYSNVGEGASAIDNSYLAVVQSTLPADPVAYSTSAVLYDFISESANIYADTVAPINGSAWIHRAPTSDWMHFKNKQLFYQPSGDTGLTPITLPDTVAVSNGLLGNWNTHNITPGNYNIDLRITDTWGNKTDAVRQVNVLSPLLTGIDEKKNTPQVSVFPVPAQDKLNISLSNSRQGTVNILLTNIEGKTLISQNAELNTGSNILNLNTSKLSSGLYILKLNFENGSYVAKLVKE